MAGGKPVMIEGIETAGNTSEDTVETLLVNGSTVTAGYYTIRKGMKLKIYDVDIEGDVATRVILRVGTDTTTPTNNPIWRQWNLASPGNLDRSYKMPLIIEAVENDLYLFLRFIQTSTGRFSVGLNAELIDITEEQ